MLGPNKHWPNALALRAAATFGPPKGTKLGQYGDSHA